MIYINLHEYFGALESVSQSSTYRSSILRLTKDIAERAGYSRGYVVLKNGNRRERNFYTDKFDDILTAQWILRYKNLFFSRLSAHPEISDSHINIIHDTFLIFMQHINLNSDVTDAAITQYVKAVLRSKIYHEISRRGTVSASERVARVHRKTAVNIGAKEFDFAQVDKWLYLNGRSFDTGPSDIMADLRQRLKGNRAGNLLLDCMLSSNTKVDLRNIDKELSLDKSDCTDRFLSELQDAYSLIRNTLMCYTNFAGKRYDDWKNSDKLKYSFQVE